MIKIDTEGFEFPVLLGLSGYLDSAARKPGIVCEISPGAYERLGYDLSDLAQYLERHGYDSFLLDGTNQAVNVEHTAGQGNVLLLPRGSA